MSSRAPWLVIVLLILLACGVAQAEEPGTQRFNVELDGGLGGFTGAVGAETSVGASYGMRAALNTSPLLSWELGFQGHSNSIDGTDRKLSSTMIVGGLKAGPQIGGSTPWRPYAMAGLGLDLVFAGSDAFGLQDATQAVIPLSLGADFFTSSPVRVGARATYDLVPGIGGAVAPNDAHPDQWQVSVGAQAAF